MKSFSRSGWILVLVLLLWLAVLPGCDRGYNTTWSDVTHDSKFWGGYTLQAKYVTTAPVFIIGSPSQGFSLVAPSAVRPREAEVPNIPATIEEYNAALAKWPNIYGILSKGSVVQITGFEERHAVTYTTVYVSADVVINGQTVNKVTINGLSEFYKNDAVAWEPNPKVLKPLTERAETESPPATQPSAK